MQPGEQFGLGPAAFLQNRRAAIGQHAGNVFQQAAAGNVGQGLDATGGIAVRVGSQGREHIFHIQAGGLHQRLFEGFAVQRGRGVATRALNAFAHQAKAVAVHAVRGQAQHHVTRAHLLAGQDFGLFHRTHGKTGQVVFARGVHARHFRGFATNQRASGEFAALGNAADHRCGRVHIQLAAGKVVQKEQGLSALHQHVVHAHGHQVDAHGVVHIPLKREFELGAHAVGAAYQHWLFVSLRHFKQRTEATNTGQHAFAHRLFGQRFDAFDQGVARVNVHACGFVGQGGGRGQR